MAIQIPEIKRFGVQPAAPTGRIQARSINAAKVAAQNFGGVKELGKTILNEVNKVEDQTAYTEKIRAGDEYENLYHLRMDGNSQTGEKGLIHLKGNPTEAYNQFDRDMEETRQSITAASAKFSPRVKKAIANELAKRGNRLHNKRMTAYGYQESVYGARIEQASVNLKMRNAVGDTNLVKVDDSATLAPFRDSMRSIEELRIRGALKNGTAIESSEGKHVYLNEDRKIVKVKLDSSVKLRIKKDKSKAAFKAIDNLIVMKQTDKAKYMLDNFSDILDVTSKRKLMKGLEKGEEEDDALNILAKIANKPVAEQIIYLETRVKDKKVARKALEYLDADEGKKERLIKRSSDQNYNVVDTQVLARQNAKNPYLSLIELENDPKIMRAYSLVTDTKELRAIRDSIIRPKGPSDVKALDKIADLYAAGGLKGISHRALRQLQIGLNMKDTNKTDRWWDQQFGPQSLSQQRTTERDFYSKLKTRALELGVIRNKFSRTTKKELDKQSLIDIAAMNDLLERKIINIDSIKGINDINRILGEVVNEMLKIQTARPKPKGFFESLGEGRVDEAFGFGDDAALIPSKAIIPTAFDKQTRAQRGKLIEDYLNLGKGRPDEKQLRKFFIEQRK